MCFSLNAFCFALYGFKRKPLNNQNIITYGDCKLLLELLKVKVNQIFKKIMLFKTITTSEPKRNGQLV